MEKYTQELLNTIGAAIVDSLQTAAIAQNPTLNGSDLLKSINYTVNKNSISITMNNYARYVEYGLKAGTNKGTWVPISILIKWIKKNNITPKQGNINSFAYAIQRAIHKRGIKNDVKARPFISEGLANAEKQIQNIIEVSLDSILEEIL